MRCLTIIGHILFNAYSDMPVGERGVAQMGVVALIGTGECAHKAGLLKEAAEGHLPPVLIGACGRASRFVDASIPVGA